MISVKRVADTFLNFIVIAAWGIGLPIMVFWPASYWYELNDVYVTENRTLEGLRVMIVDREIHRNFNGTWRVEEQILNADGRWRTLQKCVGESYYRSDKSLPDPLTVAWWKGDNCRFLLPDIELIPGTYRLCTWVTVHPYMFPTKTVDRCSNTYVRMAKQ